MTSKLGHISLGKNNHLPCDFKNKGTKFQSSLFLSLFPLPLHPSAMWFFNFCHSTPSLPDFMFLKVAVNSSFRSPILFDHLPCFWITSGLPLLLIRSCLCSYLLKEVFPVYLDNVSVVSCLTCLSSFVFLHIEVHSKRIHIT